MTPAAAESLRRAAAHVLVDDVSAPALDEQSDHHVFRVLRVRDGEIVTVTDGAGGWRVCRAVRTAIEPDGEAQYEPASANPLTISISKIQKLISPISFIPRALQESQKAS